MEMITVSNELNATEADMKFSRLEAAGFHPFISQVASAIWGGTAIASGGIRVQVPEDEAAEAKEFLDGTVTLDKPLE